MTFQEYLLQLKEAEKNDKLLPDELYQELKEHVADIEEKEIQRFMLETLKEAMVMPTPLTNLGTLFWRLIGLGYSFSKENKSSKEIVDEFFKEHNLKVKEEKKDE
jgi:hypothetical protein